MKTITNKYINEIWLLHQKYSRSPGMNNYGAGWRVQREYYKKLPEVSKREYEDALLALCQSNDVYKANFALYACGELINMFPDDWANRVISIVVSMVKKGIPPIYKNSTTDPLLRLIWIFNVNSLIPFTNTFKEQITTNFKQGILPRGEWEQLYFQVSRILIKVSSEYFWHELKAFHEDQELLDLLGSEIKAVILTWASFGAFCYGINWLSKTVIEYSTFSDQALKEQVFLSIEQAYSIAQSQFPSAKDYKTQFLRWAKEKLLDQ